MNGPVGGRTGGAVGRATRPMTVGEFMNDSGSEAEEELLAQVLAAYPLAAPRVLGPLEGGNRNPNYSVVDAAGARYVARRYRRNPDPRRLAFQIEFQRHLHREGYPTSIVVETTAGEGFVERSGSWWALFGFLEGAAYDFTRLAQVEEAGRRLAAFHAMAERFPGAEVVADFDPPIREWWRSWEPNLAALRGQLAGTGVEEELSWLDGWWRRFSRAWPAPRLDALPHGWVHGDYHGRNMVFVGDEMRGLFDFDPVNRGALTFDVAFGAYMFGRRARDTTAIRAPVARVFVAAYASVRPLTAEERAVLPWMLRLYWTPHPRFYAHMRGHGEDVTARLHRDVGRMQAVEEELGRLPGLWDP